MILVGSIQIFSELEEYEDLQIYGVFAVMACCTLVVVTLMQIVVLSQNAHIKKSNDMYKEHMALQKQYYEHMLLQYEELRKFRHDVKNHMLALNSMCTSEDNSQIFISVRNSYDMESIINQKQKFITTKEDKLNHGIGLENVRRTVKKYDGDMRISQENERFIVSINI